MKPLFSLLAVTALLGCAILPALAGGQVYTWVDKDGVKHYSDQPHNRQARVVNDLHTHAPIKATSKTPAGTSSGQSRQKAAAAGSATGAADKQRKMTPEERAALCSKLKDQLERLKSARRVQVVEDGKSHFVSGQDLVDFRARLRKKMHKACTPAEH